MSEIAIRPLAADDEPFLWEMLYQAIHVPAGQPPPPREVVEQPEIARYVRGWGRPGDAGFVALAGDEPIGAAWLRLWAGDDRGYGHVDDAIPELSIAVRPGHRGAGVGGRLLNAAIAHARHHHPGVSLSVSADNPARRLYERRGFRVVAEAGDSLTMLLRWG